MFCKGNMDPEGVRLCIRNVMTHRHGRFDPTIALTDGDTDAYDVMVSEKKRILADKQLVADIPHLKYCSGDIEQDFCINHIAKNISGKTDDLLADYRKQTHKRLPVGSGARGIKRYLSVAVRNFLQRYTDTDERVKRFPQIFGHMAANSTHRTKFCRDWHKTEHYQPNTQMAVDPDVVKHLTAGFAKYCKRSVFARCKLLRTNNKNESLNKSILAVCPKGRFYKTEAIYRFYMFVTALKSNHGSICFIRIFEYLGIGEFVPQQYIDVVQRRDRNKQRRRNNNWKNKVHQKTRRKELKSIRSNNKSKSKYRPHNDTVVM